MTAAPTSMQPAAAAAVLEKKIQEPRRPMTVADASVASGLALRDAEAGLHFLTSEYRGHLRVTEDGDLVHVFPAGFTKPWIVRERASRFFGAVGRGLLGAARFVMRAWLLIAMIGYAALFIALVIGLTVARQGSNDRNGSGFAILGGLLRMIADALFWMLHPFSPIYIGDAIGSARAPARAHDDVPFYEKVNRFVFGPQASPKDPNAMRARVLEEIRAQKGRVGLADVMRITGLPRDEADPLMARLMLDYDGTVEVADQGGIIYRFEEIRRTAEPGVAARPPAAWESPPMLSPLTGNPTLSNVGIALLNGFNLAGSAWVLANGLTIGNIALLFSKHPPEVLPDAGTPLVLGVIPLFFSIALFVAPIVRALSRIRASRKIAQENARLAILREVLTHAPKKEPVPDETLRRIYRVATGEEATSKEITKRVVDLGGDVDVGPEGEVRYRFADLEAEAEALEDERAHASDAEARLGKIVFASDV